MHRKPLSVGLTGLVAVALLVSGCESHVRPSTVGERPATAAPTGGTATPTALATTPAPSPSPSPKPKPKPAPPTYDVKAVQTKLRTLAYYAGPIDGDRGASFRSAVMAFQKVNGLSADGSVGPKTLAALKTPRKPVLKGSGGGTRVEVDLTRQVLYVVEGGVIVRIMPVSSGSGRHYLTKSGHRATALSPVGYYRVLRRIVGERHADLGTLYDPEYFYQGWAIHGSNSVPGYPASHGCIRVTRADAKYLLREIGVGTAVYIYGGRFTFTAGSSAPGTTDPGGDTAADPTPSPTPSATPKATGSPKASPSPTASPTPVPTIGPTP